MDRTWNLVEPYLAAEGLELDDLEVADRSHVVRVVVDGPAGVDLDRLAAVSRGLGRLLAEASALPDSYGLEVTSPGLERRLTRPSHFEKSIGREVAVKTAAPVDGATVHRGVLAAVDNEGLVVAIEGTDRRLAMAEVTSARTVFRWEAAPKPGKQAARRQT